MTVDVPMPKKVVLASDIVAAERLCVELIAEAHSHGFSEDDTFAIHMALEEALVNAVKHGNCSDPSKTVTVEYLVNSDVFDVTITDQGSGFCPDEVPDPRSDENLHKMSGRGVFLIRTYMDVVEYNQKGNQVHMARHVKHDRARQ